MGRPAPLPRPTSLPGLPQPKSKKPNAFKDYVHVEDTAFLKRQYLYGDNRYVRNKISEMKTSKSHQRINEARMNAQDMDDLLRFKGENYTLTLQQWERANPPDNDPFWATAFSAAGDGASATLDMRNPLKKVLALNQTMKSLTPEKAKLRKMTFLTDLSQGVDKAKADVHRQTRKTFIPRKTVRKTVLETSSKFAKTVHDGM